jgi:hypothetical protein
MSTKSRERLYGSGIRFAAELAAHARKEADRLACEAWSKRMLGYEGPAQPSPTLGDALNAGYGYLEVHCLGCETDQTIALDIVRRPKTTSIHELERYSGQMRAAEPRVGRQIVIGVDLQRNIPGNVDNVMQPRRQISRLDAGNAGARHQPFILLSQSAWLQALEA